MAKTPIGKIVFPFLFGGTFIEAQVVNLFRIVIMAFPFLFGGTFIEAHLTGARNCLSLGFPFLFGGTFIEASWSSWFLLRGVHFPSFSEGLSLRLG